MDVETPQPVQEEFTCERCGYVYHKQHDYHPFLCHRCTRYISKKVFVLMNQTIPPTSRPETGEI